MNSVSFNKNNYLIDVEADDEFDCEIVKWNKLIPKKYFNCGCCDNCLCDNNLACANCGCYCNCDEDIEDDYDYEDMCGSDDECDSQSDSDTESTKLNNFNINIIENKQREKKIRITLELNVMLNNKNKIIKVDFDINSSTYLKIADEFKQQ